LAADFEAILNDDGTKSSRVKCLVCSTDLQAVEMLSVSVLNHRTRSDQHKNALKARAETTATAQESATIAIHIPAVLTLASQFDKTEAEDLDEDPMPWAAQYNPFEETTSYDDEIFDQDGNQILFGAGKVPMDTSLDDMWRDLANLEYYDHTVFSDMSPMMAQLFDHPDDCTVTDSVAAMAVMGGLGK
jgi:hypothetical protein